MTSLFLDEHQWGTLEAAMARIIPSDDTPGAREAGTIIWLDRYLSGIEYIHAKPDGSGFVTLTRKEAEAWTARVLDLRARYLEGVEILDRVGNRRFGIDFESLEDERQDAVLRTVESGDFDRDDQTSAGGPGAVVRKRTQAAVIEDDLPFFGLLLLHTRQAFYSDPVYGGNRDHVGWKLVGFHGPKTMAEALNDHYTTDAYLA
jgi:gluconate 2-dehydrogenase gamma chain